MGVRPTELCTCRDNNLQENKFIKSISESAKIVDGRVQVPPDESNYDTAYKRMISSEKSFKKKDCTEIIDSEVRKLVEQDFIAEIPPCRRESQSASGIFLYKWYSRTREQPKSDWSSMQVQKVQTENPSTTTLKSDRTTLTVH